MSLKIEWIVFKLILSVCHFTKDRATGPFHAILKVNNRLLLIAESLGLVLNNEFGGKVVTLVQNKGGGGHG